LKETSLSKAGLSKVLKKLKKYGLIEETMVSHTGRKRIAYKVKAGIHSLADAEAVIILRSFLDDIDEIISKQDITEDDVKEALETILDYISMTSILIVMKLITKRTKNIEKTIHILLDPVAEKLKQNKQLYKIIRKDYRRLLAEFI